ncbi:hypothetical protein CEXT_336051 [Caerostris extrusa]|uniref:Uncharacterized protein n=1 Tax=Caerostris extrusa TaxID=172846 RepID=A0AAV4SDF9_CAEEX|nr:hypothetical protein CEXT_336051 [Caerostris extrusa]
MQKKKNAEARNGISQSFAPHLLRALCPSFKIGRYPDRLVAAAAIFRLSSQILLLLTRLLFSCCFFEFNLLRPRKHTQWHNGESLGFPVHVNLWLRFHGTNSPCACKTLSGFF